MIATSSDGLETIVPGFLRLRKAEYDEGTLECYLTVCACVDPEQKEGHRHSAHQMRKSQHLTNLTLKILLETTKKPFFE
jgi:hypothetical protein